MGRNADNIMKPLIDKEFMSRLAKLRFIVSGRRKGRLSGVHSSPRAGVSLEFADYRAYTPGDDFRYIDWNVYGRLDRVLVKTFVREVDLPIYIVLDLSASMKLGDPSKVRYAARLTAALAYLGLRGLDRVGVYAFNDRLLSPIPPHHGMKQMSQILKLLQDTDPRGQTSIDDALSDFVAVSRESGLVFLVSDLLSSAGYKDGISRLMYHGDEIVVLQILSPQEIDPPVNGSMRIEDVETGRSLDLDIGPSTHVKYKDRLTVYLDNIATYMSSSRVSHFVIPTSTPLEAVIHQQLRNGGIIR